MTMLRDEQGNYSSARGLLWMWSVVSLALVWLHWREVPNIVWIFLSGIELALIAWAGGPRVAQYIGPQIAKLGQAIGAAKRTDADVARGWQPTKT